ncbi:hypothetical protein B1400_0380 [Bifidobacterium italicum]|uniref:DUF4838 domain-containing protein n=1 Tax=Bifidobacterium italicum TaxID=1960968 RepID=A0A2A2ELP1_9BIFI|nr:DUF4838 domain-containing protein [Bifidobacterium italicum]PAU69845.1 hypothetical protein B1400_0380 [Bifidobacterium italicum]
MLAHIDAGAYASTFITKELTRLMERMFGIDIHEATEDADAQLVLTSAGLKQDAELKDEFRIALADGRLSIDANTDIALLIAVYRFAYQFGARFPQPGAAGERLLKLDRDVFGSTVLDIRETAAFAHRGVCIEGADSVENIIDFIDWLPKLGFNTFFVQFENPYPFLKRWYQHEFNPYVNAEPFDAGIAQQMSDRVDEAMRTRGIVQHRVGHGWTGEVLGYSSKYGWESGLTIPEEKKPLVAELNGKRELVDGAPILTSLDFSNPEVTPRMVEIVVDYARKHPDVDYLHVWLSDAQNNICECDKCRTWLPSDQYVRFLNALDERLTKEGLDAHICFLLYHELLFAPEYETIRHPGRFTMMFAPITRTFERSYADVNLDQLPEPASYMRNQIVLPNSLEDNLSYLFAWQKTFHGDAFVYDYPLGRAHYGDFGYLAISDTIRRDIAKLGSLGLNGYISCQELRVGFPHYLPNYVMGRMLWNPWLDYEQLKDEYFEALLGEGWRDALPWLETASELSSCDYFIAIGERHDPEQAKRYAELSEQARAVEDTLVNHVVSADDGHRAAWLVLDWHRGYVERISTALAALANGDEIRAKAAWSRFLDYIRRGEMDVQPQLDVYRVIEVARNYAGFSPKDGFQK